MYKGNDFFYAIHLWNSLP